MRNKKADMNVMIMVLMALVLFTAAIPKEAFPTRLERNCFLISEKSTIPVHVLSLFSLLFFLNHFALYSSSFNR